MRRAKGQKKAGRANKDAAKAKAGTEKASGSSNQPKTSTPIPTTPQQAEAEGGSTSLPVHTGGMGAGGPPNKRQRIRKGLNDFSGEESEVGETVSVRKTPIKTRSAAEKNPETPTSGRRYAQRGAPSRRGQDTNMTIIERFNPDNPIGPADTSSEPRVAIYSGCTILRDFRCAIVSAPVLRMFLRFHSVLPQDSPKPPDFPRVMKVVVAQNMDVAQPPRYGSAEEIINNSDDLPERCALMLWHELHAVQSDPVTHLFRAAEDREIYPTNWWTDFCKFMGVEFPSQESNFARVSIQEHNFIQDHGIPNFERHSYDGRFEPFAKALTLIMYLRRSVGAKSQSAFHLQKTPLMNWLNKDVDISAQYSTPWATVTPVHQPKAIPLVKVECRVLVPKSSTTDAEKLVVEHLDAHQRAKDLEPIETKDGRLPYNPLVFNHFEQLRDVLRRHLDFPRYEVDIGRIEAHCELGGPGQDAQTSFCVLYHSNGRKADQDWNDWLKDVRQSPLRSITFVIVPVKFAEEEGDGMFEWDDALPAAIEEDFELDPVQGTVPRPPPPPPPQPGVPPAASESAQPGTLSAETPGSKDVTEENAEPGKEPFSVLSPELQLLLQTIQTNRKKIRHPKDMYKIMGAEAATAYFGEDLSKSTRSDIMDWLRRLVKRSEDNRKARGEKNVKVKDQFEGMSNEEKAALRTADLELQVDTLEGIDDTDEDSKAHNAHQMKDDMALDAAFTSGAGPQLGPDVGVARVLLGYESTEAPEGQDKSVPWFVCPGKPGLPSVHAAQLSGALWTLLKEFGRLPDLPGDTSEIKGLKDLCQTPRTRGGFISDTTGLGKTHVILLYLVHRLDFLADNAPSKPILILVPSNVVLLQFQNAVEKNYSNFLTLLYAYGTHRNGAHGRWISSRQTQIRKLPDKSLEFSNWPANLNYVWEETDKRARSVIVLSTFATWSKRTLYVSNAEQQAKDPDNVPAKMASSLASSWDVVVADEGHELRNSSTDKFRAVMLSRGRTIFYMTATSIINGLTDLTMPISLLRGASIDAFKTSGFLQKWSNKFREAGNNDIDDVMKDALAAMNRLDHDHEGRLLVIHPAVVDWITTLPDLASVQQYAPMMTDILFLKRSTASTIKMDGNPISLKGLLPEYSVVAARPQFSSLDQEDVVHEHQHFVAAVELEKARETLLVNEDSEGKPHRMAPVFPRLRQLQLESNSSSISQLSRRRAKVGKDLFAPQIATFRKMNFSPFQYIHEISGPKEKQVFTADDCLEAFLRGSPKARYVASFLRRYVAIENEKVLLIDDYPASGWFFELLCKLLFIPVETLHSDLKADERSALVQRFNDKESDPKVLIIHTAISAAGINLDGACHLALVLTSGKNLAMEIQAWGRLIRVSQRKPVKIVKLVVLNSHDIYRITRQIEKSMNDVAARLRSVEDKEFLVRLLNEANRSVQIAHDSKRGQELLHGRATIDAWEEVPTFTDTHLEPPPPSDPAQMSERDKPEDRQAKIEALARVGQIARDNQAEEWENEDDAFAPDSDDDGEAEDGDEDEAGVETVTKHPIHVPLSDEDEALLELENSGLKSSILTRKYQDLKSQADRELWNPQELALRQLLLFERDRNYIVDDLRDERVLQRAIRILHFRRLGFQEDEVITAGPHIDYGNLRNNAVYWDIAQKLNPFNDPKGTPKKGKGKGKAGQ